MTTIKDVNGDTWQLVPVKATDQMKAVGSWSMHAEIIWNDTLSAAPPFPGVDVEEIRTGFRRVFAKYADKNVSMLHLADEACDYACSLIITKDDSK